MAQTQIADVVVPAQFSQNTVLNSVISSAFSQSGVMVENGEITSQLTAGATQFSAPYWNDLGSQAADVIADDPPILSTPQKFTSGVQNIRLNDLHASWAQTNWLRNSLAMIRCLACRIVL